MRLVEVVMLMGAHCVSPVEHTQMMTDAAKVQCAVVIEKDTDKGTLTVMPSEAARDPQVMVAMERFRAAPVDPVNGGGTKIVPAWAPAGSPTVEFKPPMAKATVPPAPMSPSPADAAAAADDPSASDQPVSDAADSSGASEVPAATTPPVETKAKPEPQKKVATLATPPQKRAAAKAAANTKTQPAAVTKASPPAKAAAAAPKQGGQCKGEAVAKWYKTTDGRKKYRCVKPAGDSAPDQLY